METQSQTIKDVRSLVSFHWARAHHLKEQHRCEDEKLLAFQLTTRYAAPSDAQIREVFEDVHISNQIDAESLLMAAEQLPGAIVICGTRASETWSNTILHSKCSGIVLGFAPVWTNTDDAVLDWLEIKDGSVMMITRNKDLDLVVNGAVGVVKMLLKHLIILDIAGEVCYLHLRSQWVQTSEGSFLKHGFDIAYGYACTVHKAQGSTLEAGILLFEDFAPPGWAYTMITRFRRRRDMRSLGFVSAWHFTPRIAH